MYYCQNRSLGTLRAPTSSWRPFGPLDFVLSALSAVAVWVDWSLFQIGIRLPLTRLPNYLYIHPPLGKHGMFCNYGFLDLIQPGHWVWGSVSGLTIVEELLYMLIWTAGLKMKNLSSKPVAGKTWRRKTFNLAVVLYHKLCHHSSSSACCLVARLSQGGFFFTAWHYSSVVFFSSFRAPPLRVPWSILRHGSLHLRHGYLHFQAWIPPF